MDLLACSLYYWGRGIDTRRLLILVLLVDQLPLSFVSFFSVFSFSFLFLFSPLGLRARQASKLPPVGAVSVEQVGIGVVFGPTCCGGFHNAASAT